MKRQHLKNSGFTLIEILTTVAIILILISMLLVGIKKISTATNTHATHVTLENLKSMYADGKSIVTGYTGNVWRTYHPIIPFPSAGTELNDGATASIELTNSFILAPGRVSVDALNVGIAPDRLVCDAVGNTYVVMSMLSRVTSNAKAIQQLPNKQVSAFTPVSPFTNGVTYNPGDVIGTTAYDPTSNRFNPLFFSCLTTVTANAGNRPTVSNGTWVQINLTPPIAWTARDSGYQLGDRVSATVAGITTFYACNNTHAPSGTSDAPPSSNWTAIGTGGDSTVNPSAILLDAWGNPCIFVPASGLVLRTKANEFNNLTQLPKWSASNWKVGDRVRCDVPETTPVLSVTLVCKQATTATDLAPIQDDIANRTLIFDYLHWSGEIVAPDGHPFWASAGPDGTFNRLPLQSAPTDGSKEIDGSDDNVYSFEH